jgi:hypothetical protein
MLTPRPEHAEEYSANNKMRLVGIMGAVVLRDPADKMTYFRREQNGIQAYREVARALRERDQVAGESPPPLEDVPKDWFVDPSLGAWGDELPQ